MNGRGVGKSTIVPDGRTHGGVLRKSHTMEGLRGSVRHWGRGMPGQTEKNIVLLGATGSIGTQTLQVVAESQKPGSHPHLNLLGLSAHRSCEALFEQARRFQPKWITITDPELAFSLDRTGLPSSTQLLFGQDGVEQMVTAPETDIVLAAMVGAAGLAGTVAALKVGKDVALANKESLVVGGPVVTRLAQENNCRLLPVDSEHSAIFQCLQAGKGSEVARIILTASGGPFRTLPLSDFPSITVEQALDHPTWKMGRKITVDSATMMNKALEIIEAHWLFGVPAEKIDVVVHPQSMVHSMVEFVDGSVIAQISPPDMRLPIQYALTYPTRQACPTRKLDLANMGRWEFELPDPERYPALELGFEVVRHRGTTGSALNAANEVAVARFLNGEIRFPDIARLCKDILVHHPFDPSPTLDELLRIDRWAREEANTWT